MYNFCTLFDSNYLHKGLALYESLCNVCDEFHLYVVAFDDSCFNKLQQLKLDKLTIISLIEFETKELLAVKSTRNRTEYCWTSGPSVINHFIQNFHLDHCTYVDADLMFFSSPEIVFQEIGNSSVAITEHIPNGPDMIAGKYCVQFVYFKNDLDGMNALNWWKNCCIDWCYARYEDGKFGDQKYLDYFPIKFNNVHIISNVGVGVAPWNTHLYNFYDFGKIIYYGKEVDTVFFHFHGTRIDLKRDTLSIKVLTSDIDKDIENFIYLPYLLLLKEVYNKYLNININRVAVIGRCRFMSFYFKFKKFFRHNSLIQFLYYKVLKTRYDGYEKKG
jgi:hypothetical protein